MDIGWMENREEVEKAALGMLETNVRQWEKVTGKTFPDNEWDIGKATIDVIKQSRDVNEWASACVHISIFSAGILFGFLPSEYYAIMDKIAYSLKGMPENEANRCLAEVTENNGYYNFVSALGLYAVSEWEETKKHLDRALEDRLLPRKLQLASFHLRLNCSVRLLQYDDAIADLSTLADEVGLRTREGELGNEQMKGYIMALRDYDISLPKNVTIFAIPPDDETDEVYLERKDDYPVTREQLLQAVKKFEESILEKFHNLGISFEEKFSNSIKDSDQVIRKDLGKEWVEKLASPGTLLNAAREHGILRSASSKVAILNYTVTVEAEIKKRLIVRLETYLSQRDIAEFKLTAKNGKSYSLRGDRTELIFVVLLFEQAQSSETIRKFFSQPFISLTSAELQWMASSLEKVRCLSNRAKHSQDEVSLKEVDEVRSLVVGNSGQPGILQQLLKIELS